MRSKLFSVFLLSAAVLSAGEQHEPLYGTATFLSGSGSVLGAGDYEVLFKCPKGWGVGESSFSANGTGSFLLCSASGSVGCKLDIHVFENQQIAQNELNSLKNSYNNTASLTDGFEVEIDNGWCAYFVKGSHLMEFIYAVPKKNQETKALWDILKTCATFAKHENKKIETPYGNIEETRDGWVFHHPKGMMDVAFKSRLFPTFIPNTSTDYRYLGKLDGMRTQGYLYLRWDEKDFDNLDTYIRHLDEIAGDIKLLDPKQKFHTKPSAHIKEKYAVWEGTPYTIITIAGKKHPFMFGFAIKSTSVFRNDSDEIFKEINNCIDKISWWSTN